MLLNYNLIKFDEIDSTNTEAKRQIKKSPNKEFIIISHLQTKGYGTKGSVWNSPKGNLYFSFTKNTNIKNIDPKYIVYATVISLRKALTKLYSDFDILNHLKLKWPNDLIYNDKKLAGSLIENISFNDNNHFIIGIGLNIYNNPKASNINSISLNEIFNLENINFDKIVYTVINNFLNYFNDINSNNLNDIKNYWNKHTYKINEIINIKSQGKILTGNYKGINSKGELILENNNKLFNVNNGSIII